MTNSANLQQKRALVIDDYHLTCNMAAMFFAEVDYQCDIANNAKDGIALALKNQNYNIILVDLELPDKNGLNVVKTLRNNKSFNDVKIVIFTGNDEASADYYSKYGVDDLLLKPCSLKKIRQLIAKNS